MASSTAPPAGSTKQYGGARVAALVTEHFDHEVRRAVDYLGLVSKVAGGVHKTGQLHDLLHAVQITVERLLNLCNDLEKS